MAEHFTKLWASILDSSIWRESPETKVVWVTMLAMAERDGYVGASVGGLADRARVSEEACKAALASFLAPDPDSRNHNYEGRRIEEAPRGWRILNYEEHRERRDELAKRYADAERQRRKRERDERDTSVTERDTSVTERDRCDNRQMSHDVAHAEAEADEVQSTTTAVVAASPSARCDSPSPSARKRRGSAADSKPMHPRFPAFWEAYDKRVGRKAAMKAWDRAVDGVPDALIELYIQDAARYRATITDQKFQMHPATWLNGEHWDDDLELKTNGATGRA